jgi:flagellar protein FlbD
MIAIHRLTQPNQTLLLNPDHVQTVESTPDTVITLASGARFVVMETPEELTERVRQWRASVGLAMLEAAPEASRGRLAAVISGPGLVSRPPSGSEAGQE